MNRYFWSALAWALFAIAPAGAQYQLPPGTQMPEDNPTAVQKPGTASPGAASDLDAVETKIERRDYSGAGPLIERYLQAHPNDPRALFDRGYVAQESNHVDDAATDYRKAIAADPKQFESRLALGLILAQQGKGDEARQQLQQATQLVPSAPDLSGQAQAFRALAELDVTSDPAEARQSLISALKISPETPEDLLLTAQIAEASGDEDTAETAYRRLLAAQPPSELAPQATSGLVHLLLEQKKYGEAETLLKSALGHAPDDAALNAQLATVLIAENKDDEALPVLEKLRQLEPHNASVDQMLADAYTEVGHPEKADPIYGEMAKAQPGDPAILAAQGRNLILEQRFLEAQQVFEQAVKLKPDDGDAWTGLAFAASRNKQYATALKALSMRAKYLPETPASYFLWAISYDNDHQIRSAQEYYRKFLEADGGKLPDQEWQAKQRLAILSREH